MSQYNQRLRHRSGQVACPITGELCALVKHHINGRDIPNSEKPWNICWVSPTAHDMIHRGEIVIEGWFMTSEGKTLLWHYVNEPSLTNVMTTPKSYSRKLLEVK